MVEGMQDSQLLVQPGGGSGDNNSNNNSNNSGGAAAAAAAAGSGASQRGQRGQRKDRPIFPGQHEEARANDDTQRRGGELVGGMCKTDDILEPAIAFSIHFQESRST